ncbi:MAG: pyrroloquinoline quinone-dependent dehydrogenase, partial [Allomuricauda sp.]
MKSAKTLIPLLCLIIISCAKEKENLVKAYHTTWRHYLGDPEQTHYSTLQQIDTSNVAGLELAWSYKSGGLEDGRTTQIQTNPMIIDKVLYGVNAALELFALDAATGEEIWS